MWERLNRAVGGNLIAVESPLAACKGAPSSTACSAAFANLRNPYAIGDMPGGTQTLGWIDAWTSQPSAYAVAARDARDIAAAVNFAREHDLRLVVKGGGHSYLGTSNAPDSLLIWTRHIDEITLHDAFVPQGCNLAPQPAVTLGAGVIWLHAYDAVTVKAGKYVQGGGCTTVGVAGLVQSGGFGSFSKHYGTAAAGLLEAEVVTADGAIRVANSCTNPDLFWALKGGGGGSFAAVSRMTLRVRELPASFGAVGFTVKASSNEAFRRLIEAFVDFYAERLFNDRWGEQVSIRPDNGLHIGFVSCGVEESEARAIWKPFFDWIAQRSHEYSLTAAPIVVSVPAQHWWDYAFIEANYPAAIFPNNAAGAKTGEFWWAGDSGQVGQFMYGYESLWLPASLLDGDERARLTDALFAASRHWDFALHFNKGLGGAPSEAVAAARDTATNPGVCTAFALVIAADSQKPAYPGITGREPDVAEGRESARAIHACVNELRTIAPDGGSYVSESDYFDDDWKRSYWGANYERLASIKRKYDPQGLFFVHHGVGSEEWSADGFTRK
jgi:FAD/FMN-containing dehydrogenase